LLRQFEHVHQITDARSRLFDRVQRDRIARRRQCPEFEHRLRQIPCNALHELRGKVGILRQIERLFTLFWDASTRVEYGHSSPPQLLEKAFVVDVLCDNHRRAATAVEWSWFERGLVRHW